MMLLATEEIQVFSFRISFLDLASHRLFVISNYHRKDQKKVSKLEAQIPYHQGRGNTAEVDKIKEQVASIWTKTREAALA